MSGISASFAATTDAQTTASVQKLTDKADKPQYMISLSLAEFSMLNNSLVTGLDQYGGRIDLKLTVTNYPQVKGGPWWVVSVENPGTLEAFSIWAAQELMDVVGKSDLEKLSPGSAKTMEAISSMAKKIKAAQQTPVWPKHTLAGTIVYSGETPLLQTSTDVVPLAIDTDHTSMPVANTNVKVVGSVRREGALYVDQIAQATTDTLEVFTMSHCPFGQQVVPLLARFVRDEQGKSAPAPKLSVRYIFYRVSDDPAAGYFSLHGEAELQENLAQILIRDYHKDKFLDYLLARFTNPDAPWDSLAEQVGIAVKDIDAIRTAMQTPALRNAIISEEYGYVHDLAGVVDKSPTYQWQGKVITTPREATGFADFDTTSLPEGACSK